MSAMGLLKDVVSLPKLMLQGLIWLSKHLPLCSRFPHCTKPRSCSQISAIVPAVIVLVYSRLQELHSMEVPLERTPFTRSTVGYHHCPLFFFFFFFLSMSSMLQILSFCNENPFIHEKFTIFHDCAKSTSCK